MNVIQEDLLLCQVQKVVLASARGAWGIRGCCGVPHQGPEICQVWLPHPILELTLDPTLSTSCPDWWAILSVILILEPLIENLIMLGDRGCSRMIIKHVAVLLDPPASLLWTCFAISHKNLRYFPYQSAHRKIIFYPDRSGLYLQSHGVYTADPLQYNDRKSCEQHF